MAGYGIVVVWPALNSISRLLSTEVKRPQKVLWHYVALLDVITPRKILLHSATTAVLVMYTDASFEPSQVARPGMDIICSEPGGLNFQGITSTVTELVLDALQETAAQIAPLEALTVGPLGKACVSNKFFFFACIWTALVRGHSGSDDLAQILALCPVVWASHSARVWIELIPMDGNPADG